MLTPAHNGEAMTEHTTIQITEAQARELAARKTHENESYKSVIARLLEDSKNGGYDEQAIAKAVADELEEVSR